MFQSKKAKIPEGKAKSPEDEHPRKAYGWAATDRGGRLSPFNFSRRDTEAEDVAIKVLFCGVCHSDVHSVRNEWGNSIYPLVPGHEIAGEVTEVGNKVTKFKVGDKVGFGCMARSCQSCDSCINNLENYCPKAIFTYNSIDYDGTKTYGGFSDIMVAPERYVVRMPENLPLCKSAPLLCAGITVYSAMKYYGLTEPGMHIGVVGLGGLGHVAVKFAKAFGLKVTVISTSPNKKKNAIELGADDFIFSKCQEEMQEAVGSMDGIIDTASAAHPLLPLIELLKNHRKLVMVGEPSKSMALPEKPVSNGTALHTGRKTVAGSCIGGMKETQEMMDFAGKHNITADIELIPMTYVNKAIEHISKGNISFRYVIDMGKTLSES